MTKIKICGLKSEQDISYANELKPDYVGFVFYKPRPRYVSPDQAAKLRSLLDPSIPVVGVFVNEPLENVITLLEQQIIQMVQLHGTESDEYIKKIKSLQKGAVIKAALIHSHEDYEKALTSPADYLLLDSGLGSGKPFDWSYISQTERDYFLAGGLDEKNVKNAINKLHPFAVDASSSLETDGIKDYEKIKAFINAVRR